MEFFMKRVFFVFVLLAALIISVPSFADNSHPDPQVSVVVVDPLTEEIILEIQFKDTPDERAIDELTRQAVVNHQCLAKGDFSHPSTEISHNEVSPMEIFCCVPYPPIQQYHSYLHYQYDIFGYCEVYRSTMDICTNCYAVRNTTPYTYFRKHTIGNGMYNCPH